MMVSSEVGESFVLGFVVTVLVLLWLAIPVESAVDKYNAAEVLC